MGMRVGYTFSLVPRSWNSQLSIVFHNSVFGSWGLCRRTKSLYCKPSLSATLICYSIRYFPIGLGNGKAIGLFLMAMDSIKPISDNLPQPSWQHMSWPKFVGKVGILNFLSLFQPPRASQYSFLNLNWRQIAKLKQRSSQDGIWEPTCLK